MGGLVRLVGSPIGPDRLEQGVLIVRDERRRRLHPGLDRELLGVKVGVRRSRGELVGDDDKPAVEVTPGNGGLQGDQRRQPGEDLARCDVRASGGSRRRFIGE